MKQANDKMNISLKVLQWAFFALLLSASFIQCHEIIFLDPEDCFRNQLLRTKKILASTNTKCRFRIQI